VSWLQRLYETYERCYGAPQFEKTPAIPVAHIQQQAHIEIVLDRDGRFLRASVLNRENTVIPATEGSAGRTSTPVPHPLCDKIQYCASDYCKFGGAKDSSFEEYLHQLRAWQSADPTPMAQAVLRYVEKGMVVADLIQARVLSCDSGSNLLTEWIGDGPAPDIFKVLTPKNGKRDPGDALVRWRVEIPADDTASTNLNSAVWEDPATRDSWIRFTTAQATVRGLCMVTGEVTALAENHPKRLRHGADGAKLLSSNDSTGFTFRGRFDDALQAYGVGSIVSQKAHNALRWLIERQGYKSGDQVFVAWAVSGKDIPDPYQNTAHIFGVTESSDSQQDSIYSGDAGQHFALRLKRAIAGYRAQLSDSDQVVVMGLDSATPGRMAITFYRELTGSEFLDRVTAWHERCSWWQNYAKDNQFTGAPAPAEIAEAAYGKRIGKKQELRKATVERLLPCIVDGRPLPRDLVEAAVRRASNRTGLENWEWEKCLGIACALVRGSEWKENYRMALEEGRTARDYLYGRLLAIAENIEYCALRIANEERDTTAAKLMQRFASHPYSTWRSIELALTPYRTRLRANRPGTLVKREKLLDTVLDLFHSDEFTNDSKLSGEFLRGYHCQRAALWHKPSLDNPAEGGEPTKEGEEE
jgi:CRISPR-associated protein Csd1